MEAPSFGERVRLTREAFGEWFTRRELARRAAVSPSTVSRIERDQHVPETAIVERIADALGVPRDHLLSLAGYTAVRASGPIVLEPLPPLQQVERALHAGPWKPEIKAAVFTILRETALA